MTVKDEWQQKRSSPKSSRPTSRDLAFSFIPRCVQGHTSPQGIDAGGLPRRRLRLAMTVKIAMPLPVSAGLTIGTDSNDCKNGWGKCSGFAVGGGELRVFRDLRLERIDGRKFLFRTDEREKIQVRRFTVNIGVEIQDVRFDRHRERADGGLQADVHHGLVPGTVREDDAAGVSAEFRNELEGFGADVRRRKSDGVPEALARDDWAADAVRASEEFVRALDIAAFKRETHFRGTHHFIVEIDGSEVARREPRELRAKFVKAAMSAGAEMMIMAEYEELRIPFAFQFLAHKAFKRHFREFMRKRNHLEINAERPDDFFFLGSRRQKRRLARSAQNITRVRLVGDDRRRQVARIRLFAEHAEKFLMPEVAAVESTGGDGARNHSPAPRKHLGSKRPG